MRSKFKIMFFAVLLGVFMAIGPGQPAKAQLTAVGPVNPDTGFPVSFSDANGLSLGLCDVGGAVAEEPPCIPELANPALGFVQGNIVEALYYGATSVFDGAAGESFLAICAVEAAGGPIVGSETVINFALIRLQGLTPSTSGFSATTPCGVFDNLTTDDTGEVRAEVSLVGAPPTFQTALLGPVHMFAGNGTAGLFPGHLGDGITPAPLQGEIQTGGGTLFTVTGPNVAAGTQTDQFSVVGKIFALAPVAASPPPVTFTRDRAGNGTLDFRFVAPRFSATAQAIGLVTPLPGVVEPFQLTLAGGRFTGSIPIVAADVLPTEVEITFNLGIAGETIQTLPVTEKKGGLPGIPLLLLDE